MSPTKYQKLAEQLELAIVERRMPPGARLPSIRELMQQEELSMATVTSALNLLEEKGLIEPRDKSGFYVKASSLDFPQTHEPAISKLNDQATEVTAYWPASDLLPEKKLKSLTASILRRNPKLAIQRPEGSGHWKLLRELAKHSANSGCFLRESDLIVTQGAREGIALALRVLTEPGDTVLVQHPITPLFDEMLKQFSLTPVLIESRAVSPGFLDEVRALQTMPGAPKTLLITSNFHYPSGDLLSIEVKRELLQIADEYELAIIEDDVFGDLQHQGPRPPPLKSYDSQDNVIYVSSCSKSIAPGLAVGWLAGGRWHARVAALKRAIASPVNGLSQLIIAEYLEQGSYKPQLRKMRASLENRAESIFSLVKPLLGTSVQLCQIKGAFALYIPVPSAISGQKFRAHCRLEYASLFANENPLLTVLDDGIVSNSSHELDENQRQELSKFCLYLKNLLDNK